METQKRSIVKSVTFRIIATIITFLVVYLFTNDPFISTGVTLLENLIKMFFYYFHERAWNNVSWGLTE